MIDKQARSITGTRQPSHIHVPRPSRLGRPEDDAACLREQLGDRAARYPEHLERTTGR
jgi:hypothetical protein